MTAKVKPNEIHLTRVYDAPVKAVWEAWVDPAQVKEWWGPRGFTLTTESKDVRTGGGWVYVMHGPDGTDFPNHTTYLEVEQYSRLVYDHGANPDRPPMFRVTALFSESNGKTTLEMTMAFPSVEVATATKKFIKQAGGDATWDRLAEFLAHKYEKKEKFIISRSFSVSREKMFRLWTDPKQFSQWIPPTGFRMEFLRDVIKPGASTFYFMTNDAGVDMYGRAHYVELTAPNRLVYTQQFCDKNEKISRHPMAPTWPETMRSVVTFSEEGPNQTRITLDWTPDGNVTKPELDMFTKERAGMTQGWTGSFDKLEECLAKV